MSSKIAPNYNKDAHTRNTIPTVDRSNVDEAYRFGLLPLLHWLVYEEGGRKVVNENRFPPNSSAQQSKDVEAKIRLALTAEFANFKVDGPAADALIEAHLAAVRWTDANNASVPNFDARDVQESLYLQHMGAVTWWLWEDSASGSFSLPW